MKQCKFCLKFFTFDSYPCKWVGENNEVVMRKGKDNWKGSFSKVCEKKVKL
jgi:hypothetical protein